MIHKTWAADGNVWDSWCVTENVDGTYDTVDGVSHLSANLYLYLGDGHLQYVFRLDTLHTPSRGDANIYPCRKDARRMECGRSADQAQRCDGGHNCKPYVSRTLVSWSRDPVE